MTIDLNELECKALAADADATWRVYRCHGIQAEEACGIKRGPFVSDDEDAYQIGVVFDTSRDECHHHMDGAEAEHIAANSPDVTLALIARIRELEATLLDMVDISEHAAVIKSDVDDVRAIVAKGVTL